MISVQFLGKLQDVTKVGSHTIDIPREVSDTDQLRTWLDEQFNLAGALSDPSVRVAINHAFISKPQTIQPGDEIAFLPPVGGG